MYFVRVAVALLFFMVCYGQAQDTFDVAVVKPNHSSVGSYSLGCRGKDTKVSMDVVPRGRCVGTNVPLRVLIAYAYDFDVALMDNIVGGPRWIDSDPFDVEASAPPETTQSQLHLMLRNLLAERFKLIVEEDTKQVTGIAIIRGTDTLRLKPPSKDKPPYVAAYAGTSGLDPVEVEAINASMTDLATFLSRGLQRTVVDKTGLGGNYDFHVTLGDDNAAPRSSTQVRVVVRLTEPFLPEFSAALQKQAGLQLRVGKVPGRFVTIKHVEQLRPDGGK